MPLALPIVRSSPPPLLSLAGFASPWPGALMIWRADGAGEFQPFRLIEAPSIVGETLTALQPGPLWRSDMRASVGVTLRGGVLASVTPEAALGGANAIALLDAAGTVEIVTAARVELIGPQRFRLSQLVRGIGGSEAAASRSLPAGSRVVVLDGAAVPLTTELADLGVSYRYRIGPASRDVGDPTMTEIVLAAGPDCPLPMAPVRVRASRSAAGVALGWLRRTRIDGDAWDVAEVPLGEAEERYQLTVLDGSAARRDVIVAGPGFDYPNALEAADLGSAQDHFDLVIAQMSAVTGRGHEWRGRVAVR